MFGVLSFFFSFFTYLVFFTVWIWNWESKLIIKQFNSFTLLQVSCRAGRFVIQLFCMLLYLWQDSSWLEMVLQWGEINVKETQTTWTAIHITHIYTDIQYSAHWLLKGKSDTLFTHLTHSTRPTWLKMASTTKSNGRLTSIILHVSVYDLKVEIVFFILHVKWRDPASQVR